MNTAKHLTENPRMDLVKKEASRWFGVRKSGEAPPGLERWIPAVHILEADKEIAIKAELPGMKANEVNVSVVGEVLSIAGERKPKRSGDLRNGKQPGLDYGTFFLCFRLPACLDRKHVSSRFDKGVLEISLKPKRPRSPGPPRDTNSRPPAARDHRSAPRSRPSR